MNRNHDKKTGRFTFKNIYGTTRDDLNTVAGENMELAKARLATRYPKPSPEERRQGIGTDPFPDFRTIPAAKLAVKDAARAVRNKIQQAVDAIGKTSTVRKAIPARPRHLGR